MPHKIGVLILCLLSMNTNSSTDSSGEADLKSQLQNADHLFQQSFLQKTEDEQEKMLEHAREVLVSLTKAHAENAQAFAQLAQVTGKLAIFRGNREKIILGDKTKEAVDRALELDPANSLAHAVLGVWNYELSELGALEKFFGKILYGSIPDGNLNEALKHLEKAVKQEPNTIFFHFALAKVLKKMGRKKDAEQHLKIGLELPDTVASDPFTKKDIRAFLKDL